MESRKKISAENLKFELLDEQSPELLKELHLLTHDGNLNADARRKLKQVNHLFNLIKPAIADILSRHSEFTLIDVGAGKAYLGFILYDLVLKNRAEGEIISIESRPELVKKSEEIASRLGFKRMKFENIAAQDFKSEKAAHLVTALHACDTATDDALILAVKNKVDHIAVVPCCQAEVAQQLKGVKLPSALGEIWSQGIHRREFGSHLTNVIRALILEALGYQVTVTELVGWEHSLKNEFILAKRVHRENQKALGKLKDLLNQIPVRPKIVREFFPEI